ncbi:DUF3592 domain-containing protein [Maribellus maritimus]|uniref:DUF3592 domain-containing protein n=1 Tax=Maribellus maritimus TaxID=2870838 RepID=UPI001EEADFD3|nr:DUF3592 domain-containing protein [Maribellus maritimus]MCG6188683.1 DUF3592 domain-containing protein [Maribellus maritimus]
MRKRQSPIGTLIFAVVFFVAGLMAYQYLTKPIAEEAEEAKEWPTTQGTITLAKLNKTRNNEGKDMYSASVQYDYTVDGKEYNCSAIRTLDGSTSSKSSVKKTLKKYAKGKTVLVHYDPEFPNTAVLEPGTGFMLGILLKLPLLFCIVSVLMVVNLFKRFLFGR